MQDSTFLEMHMTQSHDTQQEPIPSGVRSISGAVHWGAKRNPALPPHDKIKNPHFLARVSLLTLKHNSKIIYVKDWAKSKKTA